MYNPSSPLPQNYTKICTVIIKVLFVGARYWEKWLN